MNGECTGLTETFSAVRALERLLLTVNVPGNLIKVNLDFSILDFS